MLRAAPSGICATIEDVAALQARLRQRREAKSRNAQSSRQQLEGGECLVPADYALSHRLSNDALRLKRISNDDMLPEVKQRVLERIQRQRQHLLRSQVFSASLAKSTRAHTDVSSGVLLPEDNTVTAACETQPGQASDPFLTFRRSDAVEQLSEDELNPLASEDTRQYRPRGSSGTPDSSSGDYLDETMASLNLGSPDMPGIQSRHTTAASDSQRQARAVADSAIDDTIGDRLHASLPTIQVLQDTAEPPDVGEPRELEAATMGGQLCPQHLSSESWRRRMANLRRAQLRTQPGAEDNYHAADLFSLPRFDSEEQLWAQRRRRSQHTRHWSVDGAGQTGQQVEQENCDSLARARRELYTVWLRSQTAGIMETTPPREGRFERYMQ